MFYTCLPVRMFREYYWGATGVHIWSTVGKSLSKLVAPVCFFSYHLSRLIWTSTPVVLRSVPLITVKLRWQPCHTLTIYLEFFLLRWAYLCLLFFKIPITLLIGRSSLSWMSLKGIRTSCLSHTLQIFSLSCEFSCIHESRCSVSINAINTVSFIKSKFWNWYAYVLIIKLLVSIYWVN